MRCRKRRKDSSKISDIAFPLESNSHCIIIGISRIRLPPFSKSMFLHELLCLSTFTKSFGICQLETHHLSSTPRVLGSRQAAGCQPATREFHPSVVLTKQPNAVTRSRLGVSHLPTVIAAPVDHPALTTGSIAVLRMEGSRRSCCDGLRFHASKGEFLTNGYPVFKLHWRNLYPFTYPDFQGQI